MTVTTPSSTATVRFSTTKIDALIKKSNSSSELGVGLNDYIVTCIFIEIPRNTMALSGRVEVDLTLALGYLMVGVASDVIVCHVIHIIGLFK